MSKNILLAAFVFGSMVLSSCTQKTAESKGISKTVESTSNLYSYIGKEFKVTFNAIYKTKDYTLQDLTPTTGYSRQSVLSSITYTTKYLFGPLTERAIGGMKTNFVITPDFDHITEGADGELSIPYNYAGTWILSNKEVVGGKLAPIPLPYNYTNLITANWLNCTDSAPDHQTESFFWYFWDPERFGCDHKLDVEYQMITVQLGEQTINQANSYPEYQNLIQSNGVKDNLQMTFAFGYVEDVEDSNPDVDLDYGMGQFRSFKQFMDQQAKTLSLTRTPILQQEYLNSVYPTKQIGYRYVGIKNGVKIEVKVVASANIDQMELFAKSYAHDHDGFFAWFGHSRVGSGFDANNFLNIVRYNPEFYTLSPNYQLVYWAGCNSYSYYTLPFFDQKSKMDKVNDPNGTKKLDIIANALPSLFSFNAANAKIAYKALINWEKPTSYQSIVSSLEKYAQNYGYKVIVNVLGDEDNTSK